MQAANDTHRARRKVRRGPHHKLRLLARLLGVLALFALAWGVSSLQAQPRDTDDRPKARLQVQFLLHGRPTPATLIVASEGYRREFSEVSRIDAEVPLRATYTLLASVPAGGETTFKDVIPELTLPSKGMSVDIHIQDGALMNAFAPALLIEERGAKAMVTSRVSPDPKLGEAIHVRSDVNGTPGKQVILDTLIDDEAAGRGYTCPAPCPLLYPPTSQQGVDCSVYCYTCSSTAVLQGSVWKENFNLCSLTLDTGGGAQTQSVFEPLPKAHGGVALLAALRDDAALIPHRAALVGVDSDYRRELRPPLNERSYPDFVAPPGRYHYEVTVSDPSVHKGRLTYALPMPVEDGLNRAFLLYLPVAAELGPYTAQVLGDTRLGLALEGVDASVEGSTLTVHAHLNGQRDGDAGWVLVALPGEVEIEAVQARAGEAKHEAQLEYTLLRAAEKQLLIVLVEPRLDAFTVTFRKP